VPAAGVWEPLNLDAPKDAAPEHELFTSKGVTYYMPEPSGALALQALQKLREEGEAAAVIWAVEELLGEETFDALISSEISASQLKALISHIGGLVFGAAEGN
jgi:hypothetical protein